MVTLCIAITYRIWKFGVTTQLNGDRSLIKVEMKMCPSPQWPLIWCWPNRAFSFSSWRTRKCSLWTVAKSQRQLGHVACFRLDQQRGYIKYPCCLCMQGIRAREKNWPPIPDFTHGDPNILHEPIVGRKRIYSPPHTNPGLIKQFVKVLPTSFSSF